MTEGSRDSVERRSDVAGFVLAGGWSSRMGRDKALVDLGGRPLISWSLNLLRDAGLDVWIAGARHPELAAYGAVIPDEWEDVGPLGGICSALRSTDRDWAVFVTVDQPLMVPSVIRCLLERAKTGASRVTVAGLDGFAQTFPAVVRRDALPALEAELNAGRRGCLAAFRVAGLQSINAEELAAPGAISGHTRPQAERWFWNVNTPDDLQAIQQTLRTE